MHDISDMDFSRTDRFRETSVVYDVYARSMGPVSGAFGIAIWNGRLDDVTHLQLTRGSHW